MNFAGMTAEEGASHIYESLRRKDLVGTQRTWSEIDDSEREDWKLVIARAIKLARYAGTKPLTPSQIKEIEEKP